MTKAKAEVQPIFSEGDMILLQTAPVWETKGRKWSWKVYLPTEGNKPGGKHPAAIVFCEEKGVKYKVVRENGSTKVFGGNVWHTLPTYVRTAALSLMEGKQPYTKYEAAPVKTPSDKGAIYLDGRTVVGVVAVGDRILEGIIISIEGFGATGEGLKSALWGWVMPVKEENHE